MKHRGAGRSGNLAGGSTALVIGVSGLVSGVLTARALGPADRGHLAALIAWPFLVMTLGCLGLDDALTRYVAKRPGAAKAARTAILRYGLPFGFAVAVPLGLFQFFAVTHREFAGYVVAIVLLAPPFVVNRLLAGLLNGSGNYVAWNVVRGVGGFTYAAGILAFHLLDRLTLGTAVLCWCCSYVIALLVAVVSTRVPAGQRSAGESEPLDRQELRGLLRFGVRVNIAKVSSQLNQRVDQAVLALLVAPAELGRYAVAATVSLSPGIALLTYASMTLAACSRAPAAEFRGLAAQHMRRGVLLAAAVYAPVIWLVPQLLRVTFGAAFAGVTPTTRILCLGAAFLFAGQVVAAVLTAAGRPELPARAQVAALVITAIGLVWLAPRYGAIGAAWTSLASYLVFAALQAVYYRRVVSRGSFRRPPKEGPPQVMVEAALTRGERWERRVRPGAAGQPGPA